METNEKRKQALKGKVDAALGLPPDDTIPVGEAPLDMGRMMSVRRAELVVEQGKAVQALRAAEQQAAQMQMLIERLNGAIAVIDELLGTGKVEVKPEVTTPQRL